MNLQVIPKVSGLTWEAAVIYRVSNHSQTLNNGVDKPLRLCLRAV